MKTMTAAEFESWAARHSPEEVQERAIELQDQLVTELAESVGVDRDAYERAGVEEKEMIVEAGAESWLEQEAQQEVEPVGSSQFDFGNSDGVEIELPADSELAEHIDRGLARATLPDDSQAAQEVAQAEFVATTPEYTKSVMNGNLLRDRVEQNGGRYFTVENLTAAFRELVSENKLEIDETKLR